MCIGHPQQRETVEQGIMDEINQRHLAQFDSIFRKNVYRIHERLNRGESMDAIEADLDREENQGPQAYRTSRLLPTPVGSASGSRPIKE